MAYFKYVFTSTTDRLAILLIIQFFIIYVPSQQPQGQLQAQHSIDKIIITWTDTT
jgi:hypothetical protein